MDISSSQYNSSASESGWTHYLVQSSLSESHFQIGGNGIGDYEGSGARMEEEEEEDLSMVSDASSGPPHYHDEDDQQHYCVDWYPSTSQYTKENEKKKKKRVKEYGRNRHPSPLDDTASSPVLNCPKKKTSFSGNGAVENVASLQRKPKFQKHFSFFKRSRDGEQASEEPGGFDDEERK